MKLDYKRTLILGFGFFGISVIWSIYNSFVPVFLRQYDLSWGLVGFAMTFDNILGITLLPYIGQLSDNTWTRLGRRRPFILAGAPIAAILFVAIPAIHLQMGQTGSTLALLTVVIIVMNIAMALFRTPTVALMPDITAPALRSKANGIINLMGGIGTTIAFLIGGALFAAGKSYPFVLGAILLVVAEAIVILRVQEPPPVNPEFADARQRPNALKSVRDTIRNVGAVARNPDKSALFTCLAIFSWFMGYNAIETFWTSYGREVLFAPQIAAGAMTGDKAVARAASMLTYLSAAFLVFSLPAGFIATRFGRRPTILTGLGILVVVWAGFMLTKNPVYVTFTLVASGIAWALININSLPIMADLAPPGQIGAYTGLYYFFSMLAASTSPTLVGWLMDVTSIKMMFPVTVAFMALAFVCVLAISRAEPDQASNAPVLA
jgi:maltose/moltooligosaccharide transporter